MEQKTGINLRGHHIICLHFFNGEGYDTEFVQNLHRITQKAEAGEEIEVCSGPDDVCAMCPYLKEGKCFFNKDADAGIQDMDRFAAELLGLEIGGKNKWPAIRNKLPSIFLEWSRRYCRECSWKRACEKKEEFRNLLRRS